MGLYSEKYKKANEIPDGSEIAIPNDPTNQARALKLLDANGLLKLKKTLVYLEIQVVLLKIRRN